MTDLTGTAALVALSKTGSGTPSLTTKYIDEVGTFRASDDGYDGYSEVEVDAYPYTDYIHITDNGVYEPPDGIAGYYEAYVDVSLALPLKVGTTMDDISKIICRNDRVVDADCGNYSLYVDSLNIWWVAIYAESPDDYSRLAAGYVMQGGSQSTNPDWSTLEWTIDSNGLITGSIYWGPFGYNHQGKYLGYSVVRSGMIQLEESHRNPDTGYYEYEPGEQAYSTFSCQTYFDNFGDPSHHMFIRQGDRD